jgi:hypothetical protein
VLPAKRRTAGNNPGALSSLSPMRRKVRCRWASLCSKPALRAPRGRRARGRRARARPHRPGRKLQAALVAVGLPKTRSGKILRGTMRRIADGEDYPMPATIEDPGVLGEIVEVLDKIRVWRSQRPVTLLT